MGRKSSPIVVVVQYPKTEEGKRELSERVASVHADFVLQYVSKLQCPRWQKNKLIDAVIESARNNNQMPQQ